MSVSKISSALRPSWIKQALLCLFQRYRAHSDSAEKNKHCYVCFKDIERPSTQLNKTSTVMSLPKISSALRLSWIKRALLCLLQRYRAPSDPAEYNKNKTVLKRIISDTVILLVLLCRENEDQHFKISEKGFFLSLSQFWIYLSADFIMGVYCFRHVFLFSYLC